jgi:hypothetical protein
MAIWSTPSYVGMQDADEAGCYLLFHGSKPQQRVDLVDLRIPEKLRGGEGLCTKVSSRVIGLFSALSAPLRPLRLNISSRRNFNAENAEAQRAQRIDSMHRPDPVQA